MTSAERVLRERLGAIGAGVAAAALPVFLLRGFTVDDAFILARYATHLARGFGYRFNPDGPVTDGVTPLGYVYLLAPFAGGGLLTALRAARALGQMAWLCASGWLGARICASSATRSRYAALLILLASAQLGAWAGSGMETGVAMALGALAVCSGPARPWFGCIAGGALAWLRPEALPFALVLAAARPWPKPGLAPRIIGMLVSLLPWVGSAMTRAVLFGHPYPLAWIAKRSDVAHGLAYAQASAILSGGLVLLAVPVLWRHLSPFARALGLASFSYLLAIVFAGGDWMPLSRLLTPCMPAIIVLSAHLLGTRTKLRALVYVTTGLAVAGELAAWRVVGRSAARVLENRLALIAAARPHLAQCHTLASIDIGWPAAAMSADLLDLAGVTDPEIAVLPGGHTSKAVTGTILAQRGVDCILFLSAANARSTSSSDEPTFARVAERRLAVDPWVTTHFRRSWLSPEALPNRYELWTLSEQAP